jgi:hypothetical protein
VPLIILTACSSRQNNSPLLLQATHEGSALSSSSFAFRMDSTYEWMNGLSDPIEGRYIMKDSFITLDKIGFDDIVKSEHLKIVHQLPWSPSSSDWVVQINDKGAIVDSHFVFRVVVDNRNK